MFYVNPLAAVRATRSDAADMQAAQRETAADSGGTADRRLAGQNRARVSADSASTSVGITLQGGGPVSDGAATSQGPIGTIVRTINPSGGLATRGSACHDAAEEGRGERAQPTHNGWGSKAAHGGLPSRMRTEPASDSSLCSR